jgi:RNA polymerase sigma-70 factor, ECF subfamily
MTDSARRGATSTTPTTPTTTTTPTTPTTAASTAATARPEAGDLRDRGDLDDVIERHATELRAYCYRMLGSAFDAEDALQETLVRAWKHLDAFEGRSSVRSWMYRIATNVCLDMLRGRRRRALPTDLAEPRSATGPIGPTRGERTWITPIPDALVIAADEDPAQQAVTRESVRLAFVAALQHLPARQRAVLILREVLRWHADEVADLLGMSVVAVNSALQRARATLATAPNAEPEAPDEEQQRLLDRYVDAFERYDVDSLVAVLHEDATMQMPPYLFWLRGRDELGAWYGDPRSQECRGSLMVPLRANGAPAFGQYRPNGPGGSYTPFAIQVLHVEDGAIRHIDAFLDASLFPVFGLPLDPRPR